MANALLNASMTGQSDWNVSNKNTTRAKLIKGVKAALPPVAGGVIGGGMGFGVIGMASLKGSVSVIEVGAAIMTGSELGSVITTSAVQMISSTMTQAIQISGLSATVSGAIGIALVVLISALVGILVAYGIKAVCQKNVAGANNDLNNPPQKRKTLSLLTDTTKRRQTVEAQRSNPSVSVPKKDPYGEKILEIYNFLKDFGVDSFDSSKNDSIKCSFSYTNDQGYLKLSGLVVWKKEADAKVDGHSSSVYIVNIQPSVNFFNEDPNKRTQNKLGVSIYTHNNCIVSVYRNNKPVGTKLSQDDSNTINTVCENIKQVKNSASYKSHRVNQDEKIAKYQQVNVSFTSSIIAEKEAYDNKNENE